jgi:thioester reductase-like protein
MVSRGNPGFPDAQVHPEERMTNPTGTAATGRPAAPDAACLVPLSAPAPEVLTHTAAALRDLVGAEPGFDLYTLAGNLSRRRTGFPARAAFAATSLPQLAEQLDAFVREKTPASTVSEGHEAPRILEVQLAQPVIFMIEVALTELLKAWGVYPDGVIGHSAGEVAAACAAGACSLEEATRLVYSRAVVRQRTAGSGRMLAVSLNRSGAEEMPAEVIQADPRASLAFLGGRRPHPRVPFISSVTGEVTQNLDGASWWSNIGQDRPPACVRTLGRDEPVSHLLPPRPEIRDAAGAAPAAPLAAALPGPCREDLELLQDSIRELADAGPGGPPVPADRFGAVFLTGATGFAGRFVLSELLRQNDHMLVHCLVRAENAKQALARVQAALEAAGLWDDYLADRIRAWPGDMREPRFGLPELDFRRLCDQVDAVYHLAAELDVLSPYAALREASTRSCRTVLELALRRRAKHVFYASAMAVFPQYFCDFANGQVIEAGEQPDPDLMKSVFPPGVMGYPWTKLVVEQALLSAQTAGLTAAIMRLPPLGIAAETGYVRSSDIKVRIAKAAFEAGLMPSGFRLPRTGPADTVSEILTAISLDPRRQQAVYHLCHPAPRTWGPELDEIGLREVSYAEFKQACQARGPGGPPHGYWRLLDRFAGYWFSGSPRDRPAERPAGSSG